MAKNKGLTKRQLIKEISDNTGLKTDVVEDVLNAFISIFIKETVVNERFYLHNCFSVESYERGKRKGYNIKEEKEVEYPPTRILKITLSDKVKSLFRWKMRNLNNLKYNVDSENWTEILDDEGNLKDDL